MANRTKFTPQKKGRFLRRLRETANVTNSAQYAGISRRTAYDHKEDDQWFAEEWDDAIEEATDALEAEARRRAVNGVDEPVFYQGKKCGAIKRYSDTLLIALLNAHRPDKFRRNAKIEHAGSIGSGVLMVPGPVSPEEWEKVAAKQQIDLAKCGDEG